MCVAVLPLADNSTVELALCRKPERVLVRELVDGDYDDAFLIQ
jgi:hypothetical protein